MMRPLFHFGSNGGTGSCPSATEHRPADGQEPVPPISQRARASRGMVLFEVMIAITVFTLAAFSLVMALDRCLDAANQRNQIDVAIRGLQNQMALLHGTPIQPGETDAPDDGTGVAYHVSVALQQDLRDQKGLPIPNTYRATITATWKAQDGELETRNVSELIYQP